MDILVRSISSPIADHFITYRNFLYLNDNSRTNCHNNRSQKLKARLFNNVISFYTSTSISSSSTNSAIATSFISPLPTSLLLSNSNNSNLFNTNNNNGPMANYQLTISSSNNNNAKNNLVFLHPDHKPNVLSRVYVPIAIMPVNIRDQINSIINQAVQNYSDLVSSILLTIMDEDKFSLLDNEVDVDDEHFEILDAVLRGGQGMGRIVEDGIATKQTRSSYTSLGTRSTFSSDDEFLDAMDQLSMNINNNNNNNGTNFEQQQNVSNNQHNDGGGKYFNNSKCKKNLKLITVCNHNAKLRINPLDIQLIYAIIRASDSQLSSTESLWLPLCLSRIDPNRFLYAHISYLMDKYCLVLLDLDHADFQRCQKV